MRVENIIVATWRSFLRIRFVFLFHCNINHICIITMLYDVIIDCVYSSINFHKIFANKVTLFFHNFIIFINLCAATGIIVVIKFISWHVCYRKCLVSIANMPDKNALKSFYSPFLFLESDKAIAYSYFCRFYHVIFCACVSTKPPLLFFPLRARMQAHRDRRSAVARCGTIDRTRVV